MTFPITPPPELVQQWRNQWMCRPQDFHADLRHDFQPYLITQVAQWCWDQRSAANEAELQQRADQELEACCRAIKQIWQMDHIVTEHDLVRELRAKRRPKSLSEADQALAKLTSLEELAEAMGHSPDGDIRRALERLKELEDQGND